MPKLFDCEPDYVSTNETDGRTFFGFEVDNGNHTTSIEWYGTDGELDSITDSFEE